MRCTVESTVVNLGSHELAVSPGEVARYAGGSRYLLDPSQLDFVDRVIDRAHQLADPAFVYSLHEVTGFLESGHVILQDQVVFPLPEGEQDEGTRSLAFCICTIGGRLEDEVRTSMSRGGALCGLFLDAAGTALLEALSTKAYDALRRQAGGRLLQAGCRFRPGCGGLDLSLQKQLFDLVDASPIGVRLNESCVMTPAKSLSFFTQWTTSQRSGSSRNKCDLCSLADCPYRISARNGIHETLQEGGCSP